MPTNETRGRPRTRPPGQTQADYQREHDKRRRAEGWVRVTMWMRPEVDVDQCRKYLKGKNAAAERGGAK